MSSIFQELYKMPYKKNVIKYVQTKVEQELFFPLEKQHQVQIEPESEPDSQSQENYKSSSRKNYTKFERYIENLLPRDGTLTLVSLSVNIILLFLAAFLLFFHSATLNNCNTNVEPLEQTEVQVDILDDYDDFWIVTSTENESDMTSTPGPVTYPSTPKSFDFECPNEWAILPCTCSKNSDDGDDNEGDGLKVLCAGPEVTQNNIDLIFAQLREVNYIGNLSHYNNNGRVLELQSFKLLGSLLSSLDLTPLTHTKIRKVTLYMNPVLTLIFGPLDSNFNPKSQEDLYSLQRKFEGSIQVEDLRIDDCALTNEGLGDSLKYFDPLTLKNLAITHSRIKGQGMDKRSYEFLPRLWSFENLVMLDLSDNMISVLGHGQFYGLGSSKLSVLYLRGNRISDIGEGAFDLGSPDSGPGQVPGPDPDPDVEYFSDEQHDIATDGKLSRLLINLNHNQLTQSIFKGMNETGLTSIGRPISLLLWENKITFLPQENFRPFLEANEENELFLLDNFIICPDERMNWTQKFQKQIFGTNCVY